MVENISSLHIVVEQTGRQEEIGSGWKTNIAVEGQKMGYYLSSLINLNLAACSFYQGKISLF